MGCSLSKALGYSQCSPYSYGVKSQPPYFLLGYLRHLGYESFWNMIPFMCLVGTPLTLSPVLFPSVFLACLSLNVLPSGN